MIHKSAALIQIIVTKIPYICVATKLLPYKPDLALPRLIDRIYVPPQNHS